MIRKQSIGTLKNTFGYIVLMLDYVLLYPISLLQLTLFTQTLDNSDTGEAGIVAPDVRPGLTLRF